jgi:hypothetical protein
LNFPFFLKSIQFIAPDRWRARFTTSWDSKDLSARAHLVIDHQFEMNGTSSFCAIVIDVASPGFALDVDQDAS